MVAFWIIVTGILVATSCGLLGCFLILRKMSMVGDAISHAVLPGIVIAFLLSGSRDTGFMLLGAGATGLLVTFLIEYFHRKAQLQNDAAIGVSFTFLFAVGIILISLFADKVDIDQDCVLYGEITYVPIDLWVTAKGTVLGPRPVYILSAVLIVIVLFITLGYQKLKITSFDPAFAAAIGISTGTWHYLLMGAVSLTTVSSFESVGSILVVAFLIGPPATAYLMTHDLRKMLFITVVLGIVISVGGYMIAYYLNSSIAGSMAVVTGCCFTLTFIWHRIAVKKTTLTTIDKT